MILKAIFAFVYLRSTVFSSLKRQERNPKEEETPAEATAYIFVKTILR
jgi:hypothetical protein